MTSVRFGDVTFGKRHLLLLLLRAIIIGIVMVVDNIPKVGNVSLKMRDKILPVADTPVSHSLYITP